MKYRSQTNVAFALRSMLWSLLLYAFLMIVFNWDDVNNAIHGRSAVTILPTPAAQQTPVA